MRRKKDTVDFMQTNQIDVKVIDVVCKIIDKVSFAGTDSVMHGTIEKMAEH
ncbi:MAG: hypothetical protein ACLTC8_01950 [Lachnospiraceae bacterium]